MTHVAAHWCAYNITLTGRETFPVEPECALGLIRKRGVKINTGTFEAEETNAHKQNTFRRSRRGDEADFEQPPRQARAYEDSGHAVFSKAGERALALQVVFLSHY